MFVALPGLLAAQLASKVVLTDKSKRILAASTRSIASNSIPEGHTCFAQRLTFGNHQECIEIIEKMGQPPKIDLIIASDVLYELIFSFYPFKRNFSEPNSNFTGKRYAASAIEAFWTTVCQLCDAGAIRSIVDPDAPAAPAPPSSTSENSTSLVTYPQLIMSFVSRDEAQDEAMLYAAKSNRFDYEQIPFDSFIPNPADVPSSNFVRPETMRLYKFTRRPVTNAASSATLELQAQLAQRRIAHLCT